MVIRSAGGVGVKLLTLGGGFAEDLALEGEPVPIAKGTAIAEYNGRRLPTSYAGNWVMTE